MAAKKKKLVSYVGPEINVLKNFKLPINSDADVIRLLLEGYIITFTGFHSMFIKDDTLHYGNVNSAFSMTDIPLEKIRDQYGSNLMFLVQKVVPWYDDIGVGVLCRVGNPTDAEPNPMAICNKLATVVKYKAGVTDGFIFFDSEGIEWKLAVPVSNTELESFKRAVVPALN